jgi:hypothetical protein
LEVGLLELAHYYVTIAYVPILDTGLIIAPWRERGICFNAVEKGYGMAWIIVIIIIIIIIIIIASLLPQVSLGYMRPWFLVFCQQTPTSLSPL